MISNEEIDRVMSSIQPYSGNRYKVKTFYDPKRECRSEYTIMQAGPDGSVLHFTVYGLYADEVVHRLLDLLGYAWISPKEE